ncbi:MAG: hypothetical protein WDO71_17590 [Bacteroidota bacterium]
MSTQTKKKSPWRKRILVSLLVLAVIAAGIYWYVATDTYSDTKDRKAAYTVNAFDFIQEFQQNDSAANVKYADKIVTVTGRVSAIEAADTTLNIKFIDTITGSYAIFAFQQQHLAEAKTVKVGDSVSIKGSCSGGIYSDILEATAITFKRSTLNK